MANEFEGRKIFEKLPLHFVSYRRPELTKFLANLSVVGPCKPITNDFGRTHFTAIEPLSIVIRNYRFREKIDRLGSRLTCHWNVTTRPTFLRVRSHAALTEPDGVRCPPIYIVGSKAGIIDRKPIPTFPTTLHFGKAGIAFGTKVVGTVVIAEIARYKSYMARRKQLCATITCRGTFRIEVRTITCNSGYITSLAESSITIWVIRLKERSAGITSFLYLSSMFGCLSRLLRPMSRNTSSVLYD